MIIKAGVLIMNNKYIFITSDVIIFLFAVFGNFLIYFLLGDVFVNNKDIKIAYLISHILYNIIYIAVSVRYIKQFKKIGLGYIYSICFVILWFVFNISVMLHTGNDWNVPAMLLLTGAVCIFPVLFIIIAVIYYFVNKKNQK